MRHKILFALALLVLFFGGCELKSDATEVCAKPAKVEAIAAVFYLPYQGDGR